MITYVQLKGKPKEFLAATGLMVDEFQRLLPVFKDKLATFHPPDKTKKGKPRQRRAGAGSKGKLQTDEDKLLFMRVLKNK